MKHSLFSAGPGPFFICPFCCQTRTCSWSLIFLHWYRKTPFSLRLWQRQQIRESLPWLDDMRVWSSFVCHFREFFCFSASFFKVRHCLVLCGGFFPCNMHKYFFSLSLLLQQSFLLPFSYPDVLLNVLSVTGLSNADSRYSQKSWKSLKFRTLVDLVICCLVAWWYSRLRW